MSEKDIEGRLLLYLEGLESRADKLESKSCFLHEHGFKIESEYYSKLCDLLTMERVKICNEIFGEVIFNVADYRKENQE